MDQQSRNRLESQVISFCVLNASLLLSGARLFAQFFLRGLIVSSLSFSALAETPYLLGGTVYILGTNGPDSVQVSEDGNQWKIQIDYNDGEFNEEIWFSQSQVGTIHVKACAGDDQVQMNNGGDVEIPFYVYGDDGDDQLQGGGYEDFIFGGAGNDQIQGNDGNDTLIGGDGTDSIQGGNGSNIIQQGGSNGTGTDLCAFNRVPEAIESVYFVNEDLPLTVNLEASDPDSDLLTYAIQSIPQHGILTGNGDQRVYQANSGFIGADSFTFTANDGSQDSNVASVTINVRDITSPNITPTIVPFPNQTGWNNTDATLAFDCVDGWSGIQSCTTPINVFIEGANQNFVGEAVDLAGNTTSVSVTINVDKTAPILTVSEPVNGLTVYESSIVVTGTASDNLSEVSVSVNGINAVVDTAGSFSQLLTLNEGFNTISIIAQDEAGNTQSNSLEVIFQPNQLPTANAQTVTGNEDTAQSITLTATDPDGDPLTYHLLMLPIHGVLSGTTPNLSYQPNPDYFGLDSFTFKVNDGLGDSDIATVSIEVSSVNDQPVAAPQALTTAEDTPTSILLSGSDVDGDILTYQLQTLPLHGQLSGVSPNLLYTPEIDYFGTDSFSFLVNDGVSSSIEAVTSITITAVNDEPEITSTPIISTNENTPYIYDVEATDSDVDDNLAFSLSLSPVGMSINASSGIINWTPTSAQVGNHLVTVVVTDLAGSASVQSFNVTVINVNEDPQITSFPLTIANVGYQYNYLIIANDNDGDALAYQKITGPIEMTVNPVSGLISWIPTVENIGVHTVNIQVDDGQGGSTTQEFLLIVSEQPNHGPVITSTPVTTGVVNESYSYNLIAVDEDNDPLSYSLVSGPVGMTVSTFSGVIHWVPNGNQTGQFSVTVSVSDGMGAVSQQVYKIDIEIGTNQVPEITSVATLQATVGQLYSYQVEAIDGDGDILDYVLTVAPQGMIIDPNSGLVSWVPEINQTSTHSISIRVFDPKLAFAEQIYTVNVSASSANLAPVITSIPVTNAQQNSSYQYDVDATDPDNDTLIYRLVDAPSDMSVNPVTGNIAWLPGNKNQQPLITTNNLCYTETEAFDAIDVRQVWNRVFTTLSPAIAVPLVDTNGDGVVNTNDIPVTIAANNLSLIAMRTDTGDLVWPNITATDLGLYKMSSTATIAAADIDNDGLNEVITSASDGINSRLIAFENDGTLKWINTDIVVQKNTDITLGDWDKDGVVEIVVGDKIFNGLGQLVFEADTDISNDTQGILGQQGLIIDLDLDGTNEILTGFHAYNQTGVELWNNRQLSLLPSGAAFGVGNFDSDDFPEIITVSGHHASMIEHDGTVTWGPIALDIFTSSNVGGGGTPVIADFDNDGFDEVFIVARSKATLLDGNGQILWQIDMDDFSSSSVGATAFDFNHDGVLEILFSDEIAFYIVDSLTGKIVYQDNTHSSGTLQEHPIVGDFDGDGEVEILTTGYSGITLYEANSGSWGKADSIWNQSRFYPSAVDNTGQIINDVNFWLTEGFNVNKQSTGLLADVTAHNINYDDSNKTLSAFVINRGLQAVSNDFVVKFYSGDPSQGGVLLGESTVNSLDINTNLVVSVNNIELGTGKLIYVVIDEAATLNECDLTNNRIIATPVSVQAEDTSSLTDRQDYLVNVLTGNHAPVITSTSSETIFAGNLFQYKVNYIDDLGDVHHIDLVNAPTQMIVQQTSSTLVWRTTIADVGQHDFSFTLVDSSGLSVTQNVTIHVVQNVLQEPVITSAPSLIAVVDNLYNYQVIASDPDFGVPVSLHLIKYPSGMSLDIDTGLIKWTPTISQVGVHSMSIRASNTITGKYSDQIFNIEVFEAAPINNVPTINSTPSFSVRPSELYTYQVDASDIDGDGLTYSLVNAPIGMTITSNGLINWTVPNDQLGTHLVSINVDDGKSYSVQAYYLLVRENLAPQITSTPTIRTLVNDTYVYNVIAMEPDGEVVTFDLLTKPVGMQINPSSGTITWTPTDEQVGTHSIALTANDPSGAVSTQNYSINVYTSIVNRAPTIDSSPVYSGIAEQSYSYQVAATDIDGDLLNYQIATGPTGFSIDSRGLISWIPTLAQVGEHSIVILVDDGAYSITQTYTLTIFDEPLPLELAVSVSPKVAEINQNVSIGVVATGGFGNKQVGISVNGISQIVSNNSASYVPTAKGRYDVQVTVTDDIQTKIENTFFTVGDVLDITPPQITIHSPGSHAEITGLADIVASIQDDNLADYFVASFPVDQPLDLANATILSRGTTNVIESTVGQFDPTMLINGLYHILIQAEDLNGQQSVGSVTLRVTGDLKVGNFSITLEDKNIPLAGIPIRITRTYDSRQKSKELDFGYGWNVGYQDVKVNESSQPTQGWEQYPSHSLFDIENALVSFPSSCTSSFSEKLVTITLPNGDVETFVARGRPVSGGVVSVSDPDCTLIGGRFINLEFDPQDNTDSTLISLDGQGLYLSNVAGGNLAFDIIETAPVDVKSYQLTTRAGYIYKLDQYFGIQTVTDPNGNTLTYSDTGIAHSGGKSVLFKRDIQGRITSITDPNGEIVSYEYSASDDLKSMTDELGNISRYTYNTSHGLLEMIDPLGRSIVKNIYNNEGRLIAQEDNLGNRTDFDHDIQSRLSIVTNRRGYATQYQYDDRGNVLTEIDALDNITQYTYDADDNQLSKTDALGHTTAATYNADGDQLTQTDALLNTTSFTYNSRGQEITVTDARDNLYENSYDSVGNLLSITDPLNNIAITTIGAYGLPASVSNMLGYSTSYSYDSNGNKLTETDALDHVTRFTYDDNGNVLSEARTRTDNGIELTETTYFAYDELNRLSETTDALNQLTSHEYDLVGNKVRDIDEQGRITGYSYDAYRRLTQTTYPDTTFASKTYDAEGNLDSETDRNGNTTVYTYDALDRLIRTTYADTSFTQTEYDAVGNVTSEIDERGNRTEHEYDEVNRRVLTRDPELFETTFIYDANGNLTSQTDANNNTIQHFYDELDNRVITIYPDLTESTTGYDAMGQVTSRTDQNLKTTQYVYDELGRLSTVTDALLNDTAYSYDEVGNKLTQTDAKTRTTRWTYDALGRETSRILPLGQTESRTYDLPGNLDTHTDFNGQLVQYDYDSNNWVTSITYNDLTTESFAYDAEGNRTSATNRQNQNRSWSYDVRNRLTRDTKANGDLIEYGYGDAGNRTSLTLTANGGTSQTTIYDFDVLNRLQSVTDANAQTTIYSYDNVGNRESISYPNGNTTEYSYDTLNRLSRQTSTDALNNILTDYQYTLDASGHRTQIIEASGRVTDYIYDDLYRLTDETITDAIKGNYNANYQYDRVGNRTYSMINGVQTAYTYDANDRLTQQGGETYGYDDNGNTIEKTIDLETSTYGYDAKNQLESATLLANAVTTNTSYQYDIDGIRSQKTEDTNQIDYLVDQNRDYAQVLKETDQGSGISLDYLYGDDLIRQSQNNANEKYYLYDGLGSTRALTDSTGIITDTYGYEAFGSILNQSGTSENNYLFTGEQYDHTLDQQYLRARYYDPNIGRFTQQDSWMGNNQDPISLHKYLYANVDPVNYTDPSGKFSLGSLGATINTIGTLANIASTTYEVFSFATGENEITARSVGSFIIAGLLGKGAGKVIGLFGKKAASQCRNSFSEGTLVSTEHGFVSIEDIQIGDLVWAYDEKTKQVSLQEVTHLITGEGKKELVDLYLDSGEKLTATLGHAFYLPLTESWQDVSDLTPENKLLDKNGSLLNIDYLGRYEQSTTVYNLSVANNHTYYVGENSTLVHNANCDVSKINIDGIYPFRSKPSLHRYTKHQKGGKGNRKNAGIEPVDSEISFQEYALFDGKHWWAAGSNGALYRYSKTNDGLFHWSGSTKDTLNPLDQIRATPKIRELFGVD